MLTTTSPNQLIDRSVWLDDKHAAHIAQGAVVDSGGTFLPTETLSYETLRPDLVVGALRYVIATRQSIADVATLTYSKYWDELASKDKPSGATIRGTAEDPEVASFLGKRATDVRFHADEFHSRYADILWRFKLGIKQGIFEDYIPEDVSGRVDEVTQKTAVRVTDGALMPKSRGKYNSAENRVDIKHSSWQSWPYTSVHELLHSSSGGTYRMLPDGSTHRSRTAFYNDPKIIEVKGELKLDRGSHRHLTEIINTHLECAVMNGDFETVDPDLRTDGIKTYYETRKALAVIIGKSAGMLKIKTMTRASFEENGESPHTNERRAMVGEWRKAFGLGSLRKFDQICEAVSKIKDTHHPESYWGRLSFDLIMDRIHSPIMGSDGEVIVPGFIDTEGL